MMEPFAEDEENSPPLLMHTRNIRTRWKYWNTVGSAIGTILITIVVASLLTHKYYGDQRPSAAVFGDCGTTPTEARTRGCQFDPISFTWLPEECYDAELVGEFLSLKNWQWRKNESEDVPIPTQEILLGETAPVHVTWEYHVFHCTYQWRKMHRGLLKGVIDTYIGDYSHTSHCEGILTTPTPMNDWSTIILMKFPQCRRL